MTITVRKGNIKYLITLTNRVSLIHSGSGSGKSMLCNLIEESYNIGSKITVLCDENYKVMTLTSQLLNTVDINHMTPTVFFVDEFVPLDFISHSLNTEHYFVINTRKLFTIEYVQPDVFDLVNVNGVITNRREEVLGSDGLDVYVNDSLKYIVDISSKFEQRDIVNDIIEYAYGDSLRVLALHGLRRTGKTIAMLHAISKLGIDNCVYIVCNKDCSFEFLINYLQKSSYKYVFIDEITKCDDFSDEASRLSTIFTECGVKMIISGTDSYRINIAKNHELLGRVKLLNTVHCSYKEYKRLHNNATVDEYLMTGTVHQPDTFLNLISCETYINDSVIDNIWNTLTKTEDITCLSILRELDRGKLSEIVYRCIDSVCTLCSERTLRKAFKESGISAATKSIRVYTNHTYATKIGFKSEFKEHTSELSNAIKALLEFIGIIASVKEYDFSTGKNVERGILLLPGLQYRLMHGCLQEFQEDNPGLITSESVHNILLGLLLEDIIVYHTPNALKAKFSTGEFDMITLDKDKFECKIFEIKHSDKIIVDQCKYLKDENLIARTQQRYGKVIDRIVLYYGPTIRLDSGILYKNVEEYLLSLEEVHK